MKYILLLIISLLCISNHADAQTITINAANAPYNLQPALNSVSVRMDAEVRVAAVSSAAAAYRSITGGFVSPLKPNVRFKVVYFDGTSEEALMVSYSGSVGASPIVGTQRDANGNLINIQTGSSGGGGSFGGGSVNGNYGIIGFRAVTRTGQVCIEGVCSTTTIIVYEPIYGYYTTIEP